MPVDGRTFTRTYGFAATVLVALAVVAVAVALGTDAFVPALGAFVVASALAALVLAVGAVRRPRAFLVVFGDADATDDDRTVLATRLAGLAGIAVSLLVLAAGVESILAYRDLVQGATGADGLP